MKKILHSGISLLLCAMLMLQMIPAMSVHVHGAEGNVTYHLATEVMDFSFTEGASYLMVAEYASPDAEGTTYYSMDFYGETTDVTEWFVDGCIVLPSDNILAVMTYRDGKMYLPDGRVLVLQEGELYFWEEAEIHPEATYADVLWKTDGTSQGALYTYVGDAVEILYTFLNFGTDDSGTTGYYPSDQFNYTGYHLYMACMHTNLQKVSDPATCMDKGLVDYWQCPDCETFFADEACTEELQFIDELPASGHNFVGGVCQNCGSTDYLYAPITSEHQLWALGENATYILVADMDGTYYTMAQPPAESETFSSIAYDLVEITPEADGTFSANGLKAAQFQLVSTDYGYGIKLPNYWLTSSVGGTEPWAETLLTVEKTGGWYLEFYDPDAAFTGGITEMTYAEYLAEQNPLLAPKLEEGSVFAYNYYENVACAMRLRDYTNSNGRQFYMAMGGTAVEDGATDAQYPLYLYAAFDHAHEMSDDLVGIDNSSHGNVCTVEGCTYVTNHADHQLPENWVYVDEQAHSKTCAVCGYEVTGQHRASYVDNGDGTHSFTCSICNPQVEATAHAWSGWAYNEYLQTHERACGVCNAVETQEAHVWNDYQYLEVDAPSCEQDGSVSADCTIGSCDEIIRVTVPATGHDWSQWYTMEEPTAEAHGYQIRYCLNGCENVEERLIPYLGHVHQLSAVEAVEPTCQTTGNVAYFICDASGTTMADSGCGCMFSDAAGENRIDAGDEILPLADHVMNEWDYLSEKTQPTETEAGTQQRQCIYECGYFEDRIMPATGHIHQLKKVDAAEASCLFDGNIEYYVCDFLEIDPSGATVDSGCGCMFSDAQGLEENRIDEGDEVLPATGHEMGGWSHFEEYHERWCGLCNYSERTPHIYSAYAENGATESECRLVCLACTYPYTVEYQDESIKHAYGDGIPADDGLNHAQICDNCGFSLMSEHGFGTWILTDDNRHVHYCADCGYEEVFDGDHPWTAGEGTQPDCDTSGFVTYTCPAEGCGETKTVETPANGHTIVVDAAVEATCTTTGLTEGSHCSVCSEVLVAQDVIPALDHNSTEILPGKDPTCTEAGLSQGVRCALCGESLTPQQVMTALGHDLYTSFEPIHPTCETGGWSGGKTCANCGAVFIEQTYLPANGHDWSEWTDLQEPTQLKDGTQFRYCQTCGQMETRESPAHGHEHRTLRKVEGFPATCWNAGQMDYYFCPEVEVMTEDTGEADYEDGCGCMYLDAEGTQLVTYAELVIPATGEHILSDWQLMEDENLPNPNFVQYLRECTVDGCGYNEIHREPAVGHTHTMVLVEAAEPTCIYNGTIAHYVCTTCGCRYEDAEGAIRMEAGQQSIPVVQHQGEWVDIGEGHHNFQCTLCGFTIDGEHCFNPLPGAADSCARTCLICQYQQSFGDHSFGDVAPCTDRWQHQQTCENCDYTVIENHDFGDWRYQYYQDANVIFPDGTIGGQMELGHVRSCSCGAQETSAEHIWDEGWEDPQTGYVTHRCITYIGDGTSFDCGGIKVEYLRCLHTCFVCGKCTAEVTCPGKETCTCIRPEALPLVEPTFLTNNLEMPEQTYLGDILLKEEGAPLNPDAAPGQEIPEDYEGYTVGIQEVPLDVKMGQNSLSNPYTEYVLQALDGYEPHYLFDVHLLNSRGQITKADGKAQYLIRLYLKPEIVMDLRNGLIRLAHITEDGTVFYGVGDDCLSFYVLEGNRAWFWADSFSPFALVEQEAPYYGREALAQLANKDALLYAYDQIVAGVEASLAKIQIYPDGTESKVSIPEIQMVMDAYTRDHTEHFWLESKYSISYSKTSGNAKAIKPTYSFSGKALTEARAEFDEKIDELLNGITEAQSQYERQLILHDRLAAMITYDYSLSKPHIHDAYGAIVNGLAVCQGYAEAYQYLLRCVGIQSFIVTGFSQGGPHAWNMVSIDGAYYHTDLTWNDSGDKPYHAYFNLSDHYITEDHDIYVTAYPMNACEKMTHNYFKVNHTELTDANASDATVVAEKIKGSGAKISFLLIGNTSAEQFKEWFKDNKFEILDEAELEGVTSISYAWLGRETMITFNGIPAHSCKNGTPIAGKAASCTQNGWKDYYRCSCGKFYADQDCTAAIADLTAWKNAAGKLVVDHTYGGWISTDPDNHWKECACGAKAEQGSHLYDNDADTSCNTCGYKRTIFGLSNPSVDTDKGEIKLTLAFDNPMSGNVMVAVYDSFGKMIGISYVDESVTIDSTGKTFTVVYDKNSVPYMVKAFLMNTGFMPVIAIDSLKIG